MVLSRTKRETSSPLGAEMLEINVLEPTEKMFDALRDGIIQPTYSAVTCGYLTLFIKSFKCDLKRKFLLMQTNGTFE